MELRGESVAPRAAFKPALADMITELREMASARSSSGGVTPVRGPGKPMA